MIRSYSQRILPPYSGVVQIAESERIRAQSFDGVNWEVQYVPDSGLLNGQARPRGFALDRGYYDIATIKKGELRMFMFPSFLDAKTLTAGIEELHDYLTTVEIPFPAADLFEFWLLDAQDESPLALICSCCEESQMDTYSGHIQWTALPHSKLYIENTEAEQSRNDPPVNHRFQQMIASRAGSSPKAGWFNRSQYDADSFPSLLVREDWHSDLENDLCQRYLNRKAPRLLMLHNLHHETRDRLEQAAKSHVFEVEQYFTSYPDIVDEKRMKAMRVEAQLRRTAPVMPAAGKKDKAPVDNSLSRDMRIIEV